MSQSDRAAAYQLLKENGYPFRKHFREYSLDELNQLVEQYITSPTQAAAASLQRDGAPPVVPVREADPGELPTMRRGKEDEPIRVDEEGLIWYQEEIIKSSTVKARGYRVFREVGDTTKQVTVDSGDGYTETFEVPSGEKRPLEVKVGIPTWQVGIYKDPRLPFKIVTYRNARGYERDGVEKFFGGPDVLPESVVDIYVGNLMCYDIRSVNTAIQREYNQLQRKGAQV